MVRSPLASSVPLPRFGKAAMSPPGLELDMPRRPQNSASDFAPVFIDVTALCSWQAQKRSLSPCHSATSTGVASDCDSLSEPASPMPRIGAKNRCSTKCKYHPTLCDAFRELQHTDAGCVVKLRKLQALPEIEAAELLVRHFGSMAGLLNLHLVRSRTTAAKRGGAQQERLSGLGFAVLRSPADADIVLGRGPKHSVSDVTVTVERFEKAHVA
jgi:hypothetical protein